ncbi:MAG: BTAD domain-containing putative transcriptional regulator [Paracoccaceae bacterium]
MSERLFIRLLTGGDIIIDGAREVQWTSRTGKALLALVCINPTLAENRERLAALLWPDSDASSASNNLRSALATLRRDLQGAGADVVDANRGSVALVIGKNQIDIWRFQSLTNSGDLAACRAGLELYQGDLLAGLGFISDGFDDLIRLQREQYRSDAMEAATELLKAIRLDATDNEFAVVLRRLLVIDPANEHGYRLAIKRAGDAGNRAEALRLFNSYEVSVGRTYGIGASDPMLGLRDDILAGGRDARWAESRPSGEPKKRNLINDGADERVLPARRNLLLPAATFLGAAAIALVALALFSNPQQSSQAIVSIDDVRINSDRCTQATTQEEVRQYAVSELARIPNIAVVLFPESGALDGTTYSLTLTATCVGPDLRLDATLAESADGTHLWVGQYNGPADGMRPLLSLLGDDLRNVLKN